MANVIRHKRGTSNPVAGDFSQTAELLVNTTDGGLFTKTDGGSVVEIGGGDFITSTGVDSWTYRAEFNVGGQEATPYDIAFKADGTKMYVTGASGDDVNEYNLATAWDITTASYLQTFSVGAQETSPTGLFFKPDGTKMYICGSTGDDVNEYTLSTAWNVTTASYVQNFSVSSKETIPNAVAFKSDGTKMYITGASSDSIHEYTLSAGWDISTASFNHTLSISAYSITPEGLDFSDDGTKVYVVDRSYNRIIEYALSTAWDISTATFADYASVSLLGDQYVNSISGIKVKSSANRAYVCDYGVDRVFELTTNTPATKFDGTRLVVASDAHFGEDVIVYSNLRVDDEIFCRQNAYFDGSVTVRGVVDLADSDVVQMGSSDDWKLFYNGTTNVANVELEAGVVSLNVTNNGTDILTLTRSTGVVALTATPTVNGSAVWHAGNDGSGSGLDADTVDGVHASSFFQANNALSATTGAFSGDVTMSGTGALKVANGTTAQRPTPATGQIRYNTTLGALESYVQGVWQVIANTALDYGLITSASDTTFDYGALS
jgi:DNA-binding beta-propeller fold protein YncE